MRQLSPVVVAKVIPFVPEALAGQSVIVGMPRDRVIRDRLIECRTTQCAADDGKSAQFTGSFLASSLSGLKLLSAPTTCPPVIRAAGWLDKVYVERLHDVTEFL